MAIRATLSMIGGFLLALGTVQSAAGQVVIDMPPPKPKPRAIAQPPAAPAHAATPAVVLDAAETPRADPQPGAAALRQYARGRYIPRDRFGFDRYRPFESGSFSRSFSLYGLHSPFHVITPFKVQIVQPGPIIIKP